MVQLVFVKLEFLALRRSIRKPTLPQDNIISLLLGLPLPLTGMRAEDLCLTFPTPRSWATATMWENITPVFHLSQITEKAKSNTETASQNQNPTQRSTTQGPRLEERVTRP